MERLPSFTIAKPRTLGDATRVLATTPNARPIAGGTDLVPNLRHGLGEPSVLVDLSSVEGLSDLAHAEGRLAIGAGVTLARLAGDALLARDWTAISEAAASIAAPAHRSVATVGGNLCLDTRCVFYNQSEWWRRSNAYCLKHGGTTCHVAPQGDRCHAAFSGDLAPALIALDAEIDIVGAGGARRIPLTALYADDGKQPLTLARDELVARVHLPRQPQRVRSGYRKARARGAIDFPLAGVAARLVTDGPSCIELRVAITGTNSRPFLLEGTEALLGKPLDDRSLAALGKLVQKQAGPMRTTVTQSHYRRLVTAVLAQRLVRALAMPAES